jgi:hypothetical protein
MISARMDSSSTSVKAFIDSNRAARKLMRLEFLVLLLTEEREE